MQLPDGTQIPPAFLHAIAFTFVVLGEVSELASPPSS
jgi:hypothetical protein